MNTRTQTHTHTNTKIYVAWKMPRPLTSLKNKLTRLGLSRLPGRVFGVSVISVDLGQPACVVRHWQHLLCVPCYVFLSTCSGRVDVARKLLCPREKQAQVQLVKAPIETSSSPCIQISFTDTMDDRWRHSRLAVRALSLHNMADFSTVCY